MIVLSLASLVALAFNTATIDGDYPQGVIFQAQFHAVETTTTAGKTPAEFPSGVFTQSGAVRIWHDALDGVYRVSKSKGEYSETDAIAGKRVKTFTQHFSGTSEFDRLGYPKKPGADPADLIPIFPQKAVRVGDTWAPTVRVSSSFGHGVAQYRYVTRAIERSPLGHTIAVFHMTVTGDVVSPKHPGWKTTLSGSADIRWDCTEHQRESSTTILTYRMTRGLSTVTDVTHLDERVRRVQ